METIEDLIYHLKRMVNEDSKIDGWKEPTVVSDFRFRKSEVENIIALLERSDNSEYAVQPTASPKLPSLEDIMQDLNCSDYNLKIAIIDVYRSIKKLGNFA